MKRIDNELLSNRFEDIYGFLLQHDSKWLKSYFDSQDDFKEFIAEDYIHILAYENETGELCCIGILDENSILTVSFSTGADIEQNFETFLDDAEQLVSNLNYVSIYFGEGSYSFGLYDRNDENDLDEFLEKKGFVVESVRYDIRHDVKSVKEAHIPENYDIYKFDYEVFKSAKEQESPDSYFRDIAIDFYKYPEDICYIGTRGSTQDIVGYALLDPREFVIDTIHIGEKNIEVYNSIKNVLLSRIATDLSINGVDYFVETNVDQIAGQKIKNQFEVCGKYKSMVKDIK